MSLCKYCKGDMVGDGYTSVEHCENAVDEDHEHAAPDEGPFYCDPIEEGDGGV